MLISVIFKVICSSASWRMNLKEHSFMYRIIRLQMKTRGFCHISINKRRSDFQPTVAKVDLKIRVSFHDLRRQASNPVSVETDRETDRNFPSYLTLTMSIINLRPSIQSMYSKGKKAVVHERIPWCTFSWALIYNKFLLKRRKYKILVRYFHLGAEHPLSF